MSPEANAQNTNLSSAGQVPIQPLNSEPAPQAEPVAPSVPSTNSAETALNLKNVDKNLAGYLKRKILIVLLVLAAAIGLGFVSPIISVIIITLSLAASKSFYEKSLFSAFANSNGFTFQKQGIVPVQTGHLFFVGRSRKISDVVSGTYMKWPFLLFLLRYDVGYGRDRQTFNRAVVTISFDVKLPTFILRRSGARHLVNEEGERIKSNGYSEKLQLEGDFNKHFDVFVPPNTEQDVLTILTPDIMQLLLPLDKYEIEITPTGQFYIYTFKFITKKQELVDIYNIIQSLVVKIGNYAELQKTVQHSTEVALKSPAAENQPAVQPTSPV